MLVSLSWKFAGRAPRRAALEPEILEAQALRPQPGHLYPSRGAAHAHLPGTIILPATVLRASAARQCEYLPLGRQPKLTMPKPAASTTPALDGRDPG
ncbi:hypothetical protein DXG01_006498 [Tephrocybe rancida]|nr:hypothetical protein DXG01_006498 [Tephrocybe rancida]